MKRCIAITPCKAQGLTMGWQTLIMNDIADWIITKQHGFNCSGEFHRAERLDEVIIGTAFNRIIEICQLTARRHHNHLDIFELWFGFHNI